MVEVTDADVDEAIKRIADQNRPYAAKAEGAKAETGDRVTISFKGSINGELFDGGTGEGIPVVIGAGQFIPGFEEQLVGIGCRRDPHAESVVPEELRQREARRPAGRVRDHGNPDRSARATPRSTTSSPRRSAWNCSTS